MSRFALVALDSESWKNDFNKAAAEKNATALRELRKEVFADTLAIVQAGRYAFGGRVIAPFADHDMRKGTIMYKSPLDVSDYPENVNADATSLVTVVNGDCLEVAEYLLFLGYNPVVLNMASASNPGGSVIKGSGAQEENLFRRSDLFRSLYTFAPYASQYGLNLSSDQYPLDSHWGGVYTPCVTVFRGKESDGYPLLHSPFRMSFIAVAAVSHPDIDSCGMLTPEMIELTKDKMRTVFRIAIAKGHDALVLGALGCGAFRNPPSHIARLFHEVMVEDEFNNKLRHIVFAIIDDHNAHRQHNPQGNYIPFAQEFRDECPDGGERQRKLMDIRLAAHSLHDSVNQLYNSSLPYSFHLDMVGKIALNHLHCLCDEYDPDSLPVMFAAFFHDSIEDARLTYNDVKHIASGFLDDRQSTLATELVYALTNDKGKNRAERAGDKYYLGIRETPYAPFIKMADRLANMSFSSRQAALGKTKMRDVYANEFEHFLRCIRSPHAKEDVRFSIPEDMLGLARLIIHH